MRKRIISILNRSADPVAINFAKMPLVAGESMPSSDIHFGLGRLSKNYTKYQKYYRL